MERKNELEEWSGGNIVTPKTSQGHRELGWPEGTTDNVTWYLPASLIGLNCG